MKTCCCLALALAFAGRPGVAGSRPAAPAAPVLHVVYFTPADRDPIPGYVERLDRILSDVQAFYADEMARNGYGRLTFPLQRDGAGRLVVHLVKSDRSYARGETIEWDEIGAQVEAVLARQGIKVKKAHLIVFQNLIFQEGNSIECWAPYAGLGDHIAGRACVTDHAEVDPLNLSRSEPVLRVAGRERPLNDWVQGQMGGSAHELGHALGLPHNRELPGEEDTLGTALMGRGNYTYRGERTGSPHGSFLSEANALILSRHPLFRSEPAPRRKDPRCALPELNFATDTGKMLVEGRATAAMPIAGLAAYLDPLPEGSDYDAWSWLVDFRADGTFRFELPAQPHGIYELRLRFVHADGNQSVFGFPYRLDDPDHPPVETLTRMHQYNETALRAYEKRDARALDRAIAGLEDEDDLWLAKARLLREALKAPPVRPEEPRSLGPNIREFPLSHARWAIAEVGWEQPRRDILEDSGYLLQSAGAAHATGLYAHADSRYVFRLGGRWKRFEAGCGLQNWVPGTVAFTVKGDGRTLYRSEKIADWDERRIDVSVEGVDLLELIVDQAGDGKWADCGIWFSPTLWR